MARVTPYHPERCVTMKLPYLFVPCLVLLATAWAQDISGVWRGVVELPGSQVEISVTFDGARGTIDLPTQGIQDVPLNSVALSEDAVRFTVAGVRGEPTFIGARTQERIEGAFTQEGQTFHFTLTRGEADALLAETRPDIGRDFEDPQGQFNVPVPADWAVEENEGYVTLFSPEGDASAYVLTLPSDDLEASIRQGWALTDPSFSLTSVSAQTPQSEPGVEESLILTYTGARSVARAYSHLHDGTAYLVLIDTDLAGAQKWGAQIAAISSGLSINALDDGGDAQQ